MDVTAGQVLDALDWSGIPAWFSYAEARNGRLVLFNDIAYAKLAGSKSFAKTGPLGVATLGGNVEADYEQAIVEVGAAYEIWSGRTIGLGDRRRSTCWRADATGTRTRPLSADALLNVDVPPAGLDVRGRSRIATIGVGGLGGSVHRREDSGSNSTPGQNLTLRGDVGGFDVGSDFTWQVIATYDFQLCATERYTIDGYLGYRALSVDYSEGSGTNRYEFDAVQQGPVMGATVRF